MIFMKIWSYIPNFHKTIIGAYLHTIIVGLAMSHLPCFTVLPACTESTRGSRLNDII